jgi:hypothetical protein
MKAASFTVALSLQLEHLGPQLEVDVSISPLAVLHLPGVDHGNRGSAWELGLTQIDGPEPSR